MKVAGTDFTYAGRRYQAGQAFDLGSVPAYLRGSLIRLYQLTEKRTEKPKVYKTPPIEENT